MSYYCHLKPTKNRKTIWGVVIVVLLHTCLAYSQHKQQIAKYNNTERAVSYNMSHAHFILSSSPSKSLNFPQYSKFTGSRESIRMGIYREIIL